MTKAAMIDVIEQSNMVIDFDRKYLMRKTKDYIIRLYEHCKKYM